MRKSTSYQFLKSDNRIDPSTKQGHLKRGTATTPLVNFTGKSSSPVVGNKEVLRTIKTFKNVSLSFESNR
jgi:hypothetical protein